MKKCVVWWGGLAACLWLAPVVAEVTTVAQFRMGEADAGAVSGGAGADPTIDSVGGVDLPKLGGPLYTAATPSRVDSTLALRFDADVDRYVGPVISTSVDNFGIEAWVRSDGSTVGNAVIAYNGNSGNNGWGLFRAGGSWAFLYGGLVLASSGQPVTTDWTHLALVRNAGVATMYVNGLPTATSGTTPGLPAGGFGIGGNPVFVDFEEFDGIIDEVRMFTFAPGQFQVADLNLAAPLVVPVDQGWALLALLLGTLGVAGLVLHRGRRAARQ